ACVRLAEEAHRAAPSDGTRSGLSTALTFRAHRRLTQANGEYRRLAARTERSLSSHLLVWVLGGEGELRKAALADGDVKGLVAMRLKQVKVTQREWGVSTWALLVGAEPEEAARLAEAVRKDGLRADRRAIEQALSPLSASVALDASWALRVQGKDREAQE